MPKEYFSQPAKGRGRIKVAGAPKSPLPRLSKGRGRIQIGAYDKIQLTFTQKVIIGILLTLPYLALTTLIFLIGLPVLGSILLGIGVFSGLLIIFLRWLDKAQF